MNIDKVIKAQYVSVLADTHRLSALEFYDEENWEKAMENHFLFLYHLDKSAVAGQNLNSEEFFLGMYLQLPK